ncbi:MAG: matrixin family metalloprotease [Planctomycetota bacterium]|jgi:hypothetical protein
MKTKICVALFVGVLVISFVVTVMLVPPKAEAKGNPGAPDDKANVKAKPPELEKIEFIHWKEGSGKGRRPCNNDGVCDPEENPSCSDCKDDEPEEPTTAACYAFMGQYGKKYLKLGALPADYVINPANSGLSELDVTAAIEAAADEWDYYAGPQLFNQPALDYSAAYRVQDSRNAISFANYYLDPDIIGACTIWYSPATKTIVEFDIVFETDYTWGDADDDPGVMDLQNIAIHDLGHALGLSDVYETDCSEVTMYGYSGNGETKKRDIEEPDVIGILELYPE